MAQRRRQYRIVEVIGQGAVGTVYRAEYVGGSGFRRQRALKMLRRDARGPDSHRRLRDEARMLGRIRHRAIVNVHDLVFLADRWTIVMDYIEAPDIYRILKAVERIPMRAALEIIQEVASALHAAYNWSEGTAEPLCVLHRDLKPSNVLVSAAGETTVVDFGVARSESTREAVSAGATLGSLGYVAPERIEGRDLPAGDVFSLGVMFFEMVAGRGFGRALNAEQHAERVEAAKLALKTPRPITDLILSMVAFEPTERPSAKLVRRQCGALARISGGLCLTDWAEVTIPPILERVGEIPPDHMVGEVLGELTPQPPERQLLPIALPTLDALIDPQSVDLTDPGAGLPNRGTSWASNALRGKTTPPAAPTTAGPTAQDKPWRGGLTAIAVVGGAIIGTSAALALVGAVAGLWMWWSQ